MLLNLSVVILGLFGLLFRLVHSDFLCFCLL